MVAFAVNSDVQEMLIKGGDSSLAEMYAIDVTIGIATDLPVGDTVSSDGVCSTA